MGQSTIQVSIGFQDENLSAEERHQAATLLLEQLNDWETIKVSRVAESSPDDSKAGLGFLLGWLMAEVKDKANAKKLLSFLGNRLSGKSIEMEIEVTETGKKLQLKVSNQEEMKAAIAEAERFIQSLP
jgi:hypothetical protein